MYNFHTCACVCVPVVCTKKNKKVAIFVGVRAIKTKRCSRCWVPRSHRGIDLKKVSVVCRGKVSRGPAQTLQLTSQQPYPIKTSQIPPPTIGKDTTATSTVRYNLPLSKPLAVRSASTKHFLIRSAFPFLGGKFPGQIVHEQHYQLAAGVFLLLM